MKTAVIVQARMGSTCLPGKVMFNLEGKTVLAHVLERCMAIDGASVVCCATVEGAEGDVIGFEAERCGASVFRGSEHDVLDRHYQAAQALDADVIMRVNSDCPLIDPQICQRLLRLHFEEATDYACNNMPRSWPHGLECEVFTFEWLERAAREAKKQPEREHVTEYIRSHPDAHKVNLPAPDGVASHHRWTLDTADDFRFLRALFERPPQGPKGWSYQVPLALVEADPALAAINAGSAQSSNLLESLSGDGPRGVGQ